MVLSLSYILPHWFLLYEVGAIYIPFKIRKRAQRVENLSKATQLASDRGRVFGQIV